jgi:uncharacterized protein with NAD-binding domain and iron-sulfur cluster
MTPTRRKIAILGGGAGALSAAFQLTALPDWKDRFEITLYQLGWRLGGKGASGRNRDCSNRIEEHGIHLWLGYYENAFRVMRDCYKENARPLTAPLATWEEAFKPFNCHVMEERTPSGVEFWPVQFHPAAGNPGDGGVPSHWEALCLAIEGMTAMVSSAVSLPHTGSSAGVFSGIGHMLGGLFEASVLEAGEILLSEIGRLVHASSNEGLRSAEFQQSLVEKLDHLLQWIWRLLEKHVAAQTDAARLWYLIDFSVANIRGFLADDIINKGFASLNDIDYRAWLGKHGASEITLHSQAVNWAYNFMLHDRSTLAAGAMLHLMSRALLSCKGAMYWKLQAGMGDVVFAPLYQVLKKRGVDFRFFHRVRNLRLSDDSQTISEIQLGRQATVKNGDYDPLFTVRSLPCWPSEPLYEQLVEGDTLRTGDINLESYWTPWEDVEEVTLQAGVHFDQIVLGISLAGIPAVCQEIVARKPAWKAMVENVTTTATQAFQLWTYPDASGLGWPAWRQPAAVVLTSEEPINSWADMSDILPREDWPSALSPNHVGYLCGVMDGADIPPQDQHDFPAQELEKLKATTIQYLEEHTGGFWPAAHPKTGFDWSLLADPSEEVGIERLNSQYLRVNVDPSERYVLSAAGSIQYRMNPGDTGISNLFLAGDWVNTPINVGCVEAAVMGGQLAARAIAGVSISIEGEEFAHPEWHAESGKG